MHLSCVKDTKDKNKEEEEKRISDVREACGKLLYKGKVMDLLGFQPVVPDTGILLRHIPGH